MMFTFALRPKAYSVALFHVFTERFTLFFRHCKGFFVIISIKIFVAFPCIVYPLNIKYTIVYESPSGVGSSCHDVYLTRFVEHGCIVARFFVCQLLSLQLIVTVCNKPVCWLTTLTVTLLMYVVGTYTAPHLPQSRMILINVYLQCDCAG